MKKLTILLLLAAASLPAQLNPQVTGSTPDDPQKKLAKVEGRLISATTGEPVRKATLTLRTTGFTANATMSTYSGTSDTDGHFLIENLNPGQYILMAERPGFVRQNYGSRNNSMAGTPLTLSEGQHLKDVLFKMIPQGVISGKVTDEDGEPVTSVTLQVMRYAYSQGKRQLRPSGGASTNDLGEYRIANLTPGTYYLQATKRSMIVTANAPAPIAPDKPEEGYGTMFYPGSFDAAGAAPIQVTAGSDLRSIDIRLKKTRVFRIRGQVIDAATGAPASEASVMLMPRSTDGGGMVMVGGGVSIGGGRNPDGKFELTSVLPGSYSVMAQMRRGDQTLYTRQNVDVGDRSVDGVVITIGTPLEIAGSARVVGQNAQPQQQQQNAQQPSQQPQPSSNLQSVRITLTPVEGVSFGPLPNAAVAADGSFVLRNVVPDRYRVNVNRPPGTYLKSILVGQQESLDGIVDFTGGGALEIVFGANGAQVTGSVQTSNGDPAAGATVTLVAVGAMQGRTDLFRTAMSDQNGQFTFRDLAPGEYKVFAWEDLEPGASQDPDFRRPFESKAAPLKLAEAASESLQLKLITADEIAKAQGR